VNLKAVACLCPPHRYFRCHFIGGDFPRGLPISCYGQDGQKHKPQHNSLNPTSFKFIKICIFYLGTSFKALKTAISPLTDPGTREENVLILFNMSPGVTLQQDHISSLISFISPFVCFYLQSESGNYYII
jgi:hypothetical protein